MQGICPTRTGRTPAEQMNSSGVASVWRATAAIAGMKQRTLRRNAATYVQATLRVRIGPSLMEQRSGQPRFFTKE